MAPAGFDLWQVSWYRSPVDTVAAGFKYQLFKTGDDGDAGILVWLQPGGDDGACCDPVTVRGQDGTIGEAKDFPDSADTVNWNESGAAVSATFTGMSADDAVAFLDTLDWRSDDPFEGFASPEGAPLSLVGETTDDPDATGLDLNAEFVYLGAGGAAESGPLRAQTSVPSQAPEEGVFGADYLTTWLHGTPDDEGALVAFDPFGILTVARPDGTTVSIDGHGAPVDDEDVLHQIADNLAPITGDELDALEHSANDRIVALPLLASAEAAQATLEVRGRDEYFALCATRNETEPRCQPGLEDLGGPIVTASAVIDGDWVVAAASMEGQVSIVGSSTFSSGDEPDGLPGAETATDGAWDFAVALPSADIDVVTVQTSHGAVELSRP